MLRLNGKEHQTIAEAAQRLGVSTKTIRQYIKRGIIPKPPHVRHGLRHVDVYPDDYLELAEGALAAYAERR